MTHQAAQTASDLSDGDIVKQVLAGDQTQFQILVERHYRAVYNAAYRLLGDPAESADITQEAFLRSYKALSTFRADAAMTPWLCKIAINLSLNLLRRRRETVSLDRTVSSEEMPYGDTLDIPDMSSEPERAYLADEKDTRLRAAILSLSPEQRSIIELRHFQELSYDEIAVTMGISLPNVKVKLFRARKALRQILQKDERP